MSETAVKIFSILGVMFSVFVFEILIFIILLAVNDDDEESGWICMFINATIITILLCFALFG